MRLAIFGATGGIGAHVLEQALAVGHTVTVLARDAAKVPASSDVRIEAGDLADAGAIGRTVAESDAVLWAVGPTRNAAEEVEVFEQGARLLVAAMREHDVRRLIALSGAGITITGERKPLGGRLMAAVVKIAARHVYEAKRREYEIFASSDLDWTLVRPPRVVDGPRTGQLFVGDHLAASRITQGDVAEAMLGQLFDQTYLRRAPLISAR